MRIAVIAFLLCLLCSPCFAEPYVSFKMGYVEMSPDDAKTGIIKELAAGYQWEKVALEASIGHWRTKIKGNEADALPYKYMAEMAVMPVFATVKYYPIEKFYIGGGVGTAILNFEENYAGDADFDTPRLLCAVAGVELGKVFIEARQIFGDLNVESGNSSVGILEDESNLRSLQVMIGYKVKF